MRSLSLDKSQKQTTKCKINKKEKPKRSTLNMHNHTMENLECINEAIRVHKSKRSSRKSNSWKLVPKDSCEVYREQRRRQMAENRKHENEEGSFSEDSLRSHRRAYKRTKRVTVKRPCQEKFKRCPRKRQRRHHSSHSTMDTHTGGSTSSSYATTTDSD